MNNQMVKSKVPVPISVIKGIVQDVSKISVSEMDLPDRSFRSREQTRTNARQISMCLAKEYSGESLAKIGINHGGRDHATVLHAKRTTLWRMDVKDPLTTPIYREAERKIIEWQKRNDLTNEMIRNDFLEGRISAVEVVGLTCY